MSNVSTVSSDLIEVKEGEAKLPSTEALMETAVLSSMSPGPSNPTSAVDCDRKQSIGDSSNRSETLGPRDLTAERLKDDKLQPGAFEALELSYKSMLERSTISRRVAGHLKRKSDHQKALIVELLAVKENDTDQVSHLKRTQMKFEEELEKISKEKEILIQQVEALKLKAGITELTMSPLIDTSAMVLGLSTELELSQSTAGVDELLRSAYHERDVIKAQFDKLKANFEDVQKKYDSKVVTVEEMNKRLLEQIKEIEKLKGRLVETEKEKDDLKVELEFDNIEELKLVSSKPSDEAQLRVKLDKMEKKLMELEEEKRVLEERLASEHDTSEQYRRQVTDLKERQNSEILALRKEKKEIRAAAERKEVDLLRESTKARNEAKWAKTELEKANRDRELLEERLRNLEYSRVSRMSIPSENENELKSVANCLRTVLEQNAKLKTTLQKQRDVISKFRYLQAMKSNQNAERRNEDAIVLPPMAAVSSVKLDGLRQRTYSDRVARQRQQEQSLNRPRSEGDFAAKNYGNVLPREPIQDLLSSSNATESRPIYANIGDVHRDWKKFDKMEF